LVEDHAKQILSLVTDERGQWTEPRPQAVICDHDAEDRATLQRHLGMGTIAADKRVSVGIQAVQRRLRTEGDGRPRLMILRDALVERDPELAEARKPTCTAEERSEEHTSELQSRENLVCRLLLEKKKKQPT